MGVGDDDYAGFCFAGSCDNVLSSVPVLTVAPTCGLSYPNSLSIRLCELPKSSKLVT